MNRKIGCSFLLCIFIWACESQPWKKPVQQLLIESTNFLLEFCENLEKVKSDQEAAMVMRKYRLKLQSLMSKKEELAQKYPIIATKEFPKILEEVLPQENNAFIQAFQKANFIGQKTAEKYASQEFRREAELAWLALFDAFRFR